ncbi:DUF6113 family protein [Paramicrobacterium fandaimingii]|uniref:DUF6113 family protein n=1 Tax=Paramicrobacterium fandaimingii TaxID=2708079 RepID=UPI001F1D1501|nr:DUF6113 family protein [Microbacterium fandaimingii]
MSTAPELPDLHIDERDDVVDDGEPSTTSRIVTAVITLVLGAVYGTVGTVAHTLTVTPFGILIPYGLILGLIGTLALLVGLRLVIAERLPSVAAGIGLVGTVALFSFSSPGGSILISQGLPGLIWLFGVPLIAAVVLAWPRVPQRSLVAERSA